uniref:Insecticidal scorpine-like peptide LaIT3 n=1 Tax=Liocheles australasiae TaxID=431266 RepID=KBX33_LIOAU
MQAQFTVLLLLVLVTLCSCGGILREKYFHKAADALTSNIPIPVVKDVLKSAANQMIRKIGKVQQACAFNKDLAGWCEKSCQEAEGKKGYCHGTKCKCGKPIDYRK